MTRPLAGQAPALGLVFVGGIAGAIVRYAIDEALTTTPTGFPWATFLINLSGAFLLGLLLESLALSGEDSGWRKRIRLLAGTGFIGTYTTYSSLAVELDLLIHHDRVVLGIVYGAVSLLLGLAAALAGIALANAVRREEVPA
ncbi:MAG: CrcB family protein [Gordonia sp. (in: high G+C Gram-positive bacteria)]|uniref:FluC/FEX family fluoride channel n=1 Tax=Gordonia sp. (in: high G+C Gram-positive bacteria) TaxID=84139 RepID=UPI0039E30C4E